MKSANQLQWNGAVIYMGADGALYAFSLFLPTIIADLGYTATTAVSQVQWR